MKKVTEEAVRLSREGIISYLTNSAFINDYELLCLWNLVTAVRSAEDAEDAYTAAVKSTVVCRKHAEMDAELGSN